jgi:hypothetical protein
MKKFLGTGILMAALALLSAGPASATAIDFTTPGTDFNNNAWSLGFEFNVTTAYNVTALGFYDDLKNGLAESHAVGIYDSAGSLLFSGTVPSGTGAPLVGWFRYVSVTPYFLPVGVGYRIAATTGAENYTWNPVGFTTDPAITFVRDRFVLSGTLAFPDPGTSGVAGWFGPNFDGEPVPEPSSLVLLGAGLLGFARRLRRRS